MKRLSKDNGKVSDSGYTNTGVSQSQRSSGSSLSRNSNRSESSGYCGGHPSTLNSSNYALPKPISRRKEHKKKESKTTTGTKILGIGDTILGAEINKGTEVRSYNPLESSSNFSSNCTKSEVARVESIDATELGKNNGYSKSTDPEGGVGTKTSPLDDTTSNNNEGFGAVISLYSGLIVDTTPSLKGALGYAREAWVGHSFIDFVHPTDKSTFAEHLTKNIALTYADRNEDFSGPQMSLFCSLRKHDEGRSSTTGSGSDESNSVNPMRSMFVPFHLTMSVKLFRECSKEEMPKAMFLTIDAQYLLPVYKVPEETIISSVFSTRHDTNCILTHVDHNAVPYFGYLPQDMIGRSLFDLYHPEDLPFIKDIYETVVKMEGLPFRSKPYRFATQSGGYVVLETEWSSFINPWKEKIEFVVGHHRVLRGPVNPDVFQQADECQRDALANISVEVFKESKIIQGEIRALLDKKIQRTDNNNACNLSRRSNDLTSFVENLLREFKHAAPVSKDPLSTEDRSISERGSVMLGAISPHHEYCDSKSSSETPPSYNQLNYNDKIERFFNSKPQVSTIFDIDDGNLNSSGQSNDNTGKSSENLPGTEDTTPNDSGSGGNLSSDSNNRTNYGSRYVSDNARSANTTPPEGLKIITLTESLLNKHNIDMEKLMTKRHKQHRCEIKNNKQHKDSRAIGYKKKSKDEKKERRKTRSGKRCGSRSQSRSYCKVSKYDETVRPCAPVAPVTSVAPPAPPATAATVATAATATTAATAANNSTAMPMSVDNSSPPEAQLRPNMNMWPSGPVIAPPQQTSHLRMPTQNMGLQEAMRSPSFSPIVPIYYVTVPRIREVSLNPMTHLPSNQILHNGSIQQNPYASYVAPPMPSMIYPPMVCALAPAPTMYRPFVIPRPVAIPRETQQLNSVVHQQENSFDLKRPESQATSVKAEPSSTPAMSESSKKVLSLSERYSSCMSIDDGGSSLAKVQRTANSKCEAIPDNEFESSLEDSSDSSFYGAYVNMASSNSSNRGESAACTSQETLWNPEMLETTPNYKESQDTLQNGPPWQESVKMTPELTYQNKLSPKVLSEVLGDDKKTLTSMNRPPMVNEQFAQTYSDMELGSRKTKLMTSGTDTSSEKKSQIGNEAPQQDIPEKKVMSLVNRMRRKRKQNRDKKDYNERHRLIHEIFRSSTGCCPDEKTRTKRNTFSGRSTKS